MSDELRPKMTPIERVRARYNAKSLLGVSEGATQEEIHRAYKRQAFSHHPYRENGSNDDLRSINEAYELLKKDAPSEPKAATRSVRPSRVPSRPVVSANLSMIDEVTQARGRALLGETHEGESQDHVATTVRKEGRRLTFLMPSRLVKGRNRVVVPSELLASRRSQSMKVITFRTNNDGRGQVRVPDECVKQDFPGAHEVVLQFGVAHH